MKTTRISIQWIHVCILVLTLITASIGLFSTSDGVPYDYINQYGNTITLYGDGLYANDSYFKAPILRGTDATILFVLVPLYGIFIVYNIRKGGELSSRMLMGCISVLLYYSASMAFGVIFNTLHLAYIALFGLTLFTLLYVLSRPKTIHAEIKLPYKTIYTFLTISAFALTVAWLPDILTAMFNGTSLALIENYRGNFKM